MSLPLVYTQPNPVWRTNQELGIPLSVESSLPIPPIAPPITSPGSKELYKLVTEVGMGGFDLNPGEVRVHNITLVMDPRVGGGSRDSIYVPAIYVGLDDCWEMLLRDGESNSSLSNWKKSIPVGGLALGEVIESRVQSIEVGQLVIGFTGWREYAVVTPEHLVKVPDNVPFGSALTIYSLPGETAMYSLAYVAKMKKNSSVLIFSSASSTGCIAIEIVRYYGGYPICVVRSQAQAEYLKDAYSVGACLCLANDNASIKTPIVDVDILIHKLKILAPNGIDIVLGGQGNNPLLVAVSQCIKPTTCFIICPSLTDVSIPVNTMYLTKYDFNSNCNEEFLGVLESYITSFGSKFVKFNISDDKFESKRLTLISALHDLCIQQHLNFNKITSIVMEDMRLCIKVFLQVLNDMATGGHVIADGAILQVADLSVGLTLIQIRSYAPKLSYHYEIYSEKIIHDDDE